MSITGERPHSGLRITLERDVNAGPPWIYDGMLFTECVSAAVQAQVSADGTVCVAMRESEVADASAVCEKVRLMLRSVWKQSRELGAEAPPRRVVRWRGEK